MAQPDAERQQAAAQALTRLPLNYEAQRFFEAQFFAVRGLHYYSETWRSGDFLAYMNRLLTLLEQRQAADGSLPPGSRGVEEINQMERVYSTAMAVLIVNCNRGLLVSDRQPY